MSANTGRTLFIPTLSIAKSRVAVEWVIERYAVDVNKDSGIKNDPNLWCDEHDDPRYIIDLVKRVVRVSLESVKIVDRLKNEPIE